MGETYKTMPAQSQDPHKMMYNALLAAKADLAAGTPKEQVISNLKIATDVIIVRLRNDLKTAGNISTTYDAALVIIGSEKPNKAKRLEKLISDETAKTGKVEQPVNGFLKPQQSSVDFERNFSVTVQKNSVSPALFYGVNAQDNLPTWANQFVNDFVPGKKDEIAALIQKDPALSSKPQLQSLLYDAAKSGHPKEMLSQLTLSQKAIDGISLMLKGKYCEVTVYDSDLIQFFGEESKGGLLTEEERKRVLAFANGKSNDGAALVDMIFSRLQTGTDGRQLLPGDLCSKASSLAVDSNFGENAAALRVLIEDMDGTYLKAEGNSIENLKAFYKCLAGKNGLGSAENKRAFDKLGSTLTRSLLHDQTALSGSPQSVRRDNYDISLLYAFACSCKNSPDGYFASEAFRQQSAGFLATITGTGLAVSGAVPLAIVQNYETLDALHGNFLQNQDGFNQIITALFISTNRIYALPMESKFNEEKYPGVKCRFDAADELLREIKDLQGNALLDYLVSNFTDTTFTEGQNVIKLKNPYQLILTGAQQQDMNSIRNFMKSMNIEPASYFDTDGQYRNWQNFAKTPTPGVDMAGPQEMRYNLLRKLPQTYTYGIDKIYGDIVSTKEYFRPTEAGGSGNLDWQKDTTDVPNSQGGADNVTKSLSVKGNTNLSVSGPTGSITSAFTGDTTRNMNLGENTSSTTGNDQIYNNSVTQARDINLGEAQISDAFISWLESKGSQVVGESINTSDYTNDLNFRLRGIAYGAGIVLTGERYFTEGEWKLRLEAVINTGKGYVRIANLDDFRDDPEFKKINQKIEAHLKYVEHSQWALPIGTIEAYEHQSSNMPLGGASGPWQRNEDGSIKLMPGQREGFMIGAGNVGGDTRLAHLTVQTVSGSTAVLGSYGNFNSNVPSTVITAGYLLYKDETDPYGRNARYTYDSQGNATPLPGAEFLTDKPMGVLSALVGKFYGLALGNVDSTGVAGAQIGYGNSFGVGGIMRYDGGPRTYMANGQYYSSGFAAATYLQGGDNTSNTASAAVKITLNKDWNLKLYGLGSTDVAQRIANSTTASSADKNALLASITRLGNDISAQMEDEKSTWNTDKNQRNSMMRNWTTQMISCLDQASSFLPAQALDDLRSQFAIGIEKPGEQEYKLAIVKLRTPGAQDWSGSQNEHGYLVTMDRIKVGKSVVSFTAGVPMPADDAQTGTGKARNFAGMKLNVGNLTFGATGYDFGSSDPTKMRIDVIRMTDEFAQGMSVTLLGNKGHRESLFLGDRKYKLELGNTNVAGLSANDIAASAMLAAKFNVGLYFRTSKQGEGDGAVHAREYGANVTYYDTGGLQFGGQAFVVEGHGNQGTSVTTGGVRLNFNFRF